MSALELMQYEAEVYLPMDRFVAYAVTPMVHEAATKKLKESIPPTKRFFSHMP